MHSTQILMNLTRLIPIPQILLNQTRRHLNLTRNHLSLLIPSPLTQNHLTRSRLNPSLMGLIRTH